MNVTLSMEAVNRSVPMPLVALPAAVGQGTCWMGMALTALVHYHIIAGQHDALFYTIVNDLLCYMQISMNVRVMT